MLPVQSTQNLLNFQVSREGCSETFQLSILFIISSPFIHEIQFSPFHPLFLMPPTHICTQTSHKYHQVIHTSLVKRLSSPSSPLLRMEKLPVPVNLPTLFHKYCPWSETRALNYHLNSESTEVSRPPRSASVLTPIIIHVSLWSPLQTVLSKELQVLESLFEIHKRTRLPEVELCWNLSTFVVLREKSTNSTYL